MNYYFLLEDEKSFMKVLPNWLKYLNFPCERVADIKNVTTNNYVMQSGKGVTRLITKALFDTIDTILDNPGIIDKLVILIDTENENEEIRKSQIFEKINQQYDVNKFDFEILIFVLNHCFESWLLGAEGLYPNEIVNENSDFYEYYMHYNISELDPEKMGVPIKSSETIAQYHFHYLCELFRFRHMRYCKSRPNTVSTEEYFNLILDRIKRSSHIPSFSKFIDFIIKERDT